MEQQLCLCGCGQPPKTKGCSFLAGHYSRTQVFRDTVHHGPYPKGVDEPNPAGVCLCGCGQRTRIATRNIQGVEAIGKPVRYIKGHHMRGKRGEQTTNWKGGRWTHKGGYVYIYAPDHPAANRDGYVYEHRLIAERMLGRFLEPKERVHHLNGLKTDNRPENLVVFESQAAHGREHNAAQFRRYEAEHPDHHREAGKRGAAQRWQGHVKRPR